MKLEGEVQEHGSRGRQERAVGISAHCMHVESLHKETF